MKGLMKEYCTRCKKETEMKYQLEDLDGNTGILVKALVCQKCGESFTDANDYMRAQQELERRNILKIKRKIAKIGNSFVVRLSPEVLESAQIKNKSAVNIYVDQKKRIIVEPA